MPKIKATRATVTITPLLPPPLLPAPLWQNAKAETGKRRETCSRGSRMAYQVTAVTVAVAVMSVTATMRIVATGRQVYIDGIISFF